MKPNFTNRFAAILFIAVLSVVFFAGCSDRKRCEPVILWKYSTTYWGNEMPKGMCRFYYKIYEIGNGVEFVDSCYKYNVGDTIVGRKKHY